jgi:hypothetical protein
MRQLTEEDVIEIGDEFFVKVRVVEKTRMASGKMMYDCRGADNVSLCVEAEDDTVCVTADEVWVE